MNTIIKTYLETARSEDKKPLVLKYLEIWYKKPAIKSISANLEGADLANADLRWIDLTKANLIYANLRGANLKGVNLTGADLTGADLRWTDQTGAIFLTKDAHADVQKGSAICNTDELANKINNILGAPGTINEDTIASLPNLSKAARYMGENDITDLQNGKIFAKSDACRVAADALIAILPNFIDPKPLETRAKELLNGEEKDTSNFLGIAAFLQNAFPLILDVQKNVLSQVIAGVTEKYTEPDNVSKSLANALLGQGTARFDKDKNRTGNTFSACGAASIKNIGTFSEQLVLSRIAADQAQKTGNPIGLNRSGG
jgi:hypothetical protein